MIVEQKTGIPGGLWLEIECDVCHTNRVFRSSQAWRLLQREQHYCSPKCAANSPTVKEKQLRVKAGRRWSEAARALKSKSTSGEKNPMFGKRGALHPWFGKHHTEDVRQRISVSKTGKPGWRPTIEQRETQSQRQRGARHHNFGKISPWWHPWMTSDGDLRTWTRAVKQAFRFCCASCGLSRDECKTKFGPRSFVAHHIAPQSGHPELKYDLCNGIALCRACHKQAHQLLRLDPNEYQAVMMKLSFKRSD